MDNKLYPPQIQGTLPAFTLSHDIVTGAVTEGEIKIPFEMNQSVGITQFAGFVLKIKTVQNNELISLLYSQDYDLNNNTVTFYLTANNANKFQEGQYYKAQIAYYTQEKTTITDADGETVETEEQDPNLFTMKIGYYSTVGIIKCISKPNIYIKGYSNDSLNLFTGTFIGVYDQSTALDQTEKVYSYKFDFYDKDWKLIKTSEELVHNASNDSEYTYSIDQITFNDFLKEGEVYNLVYTVTTLNGYVGSSPTYKVTVQNLMPPTRNIGIVAKENNDEAYIQINLIGDGKSLPYSGIYNIVRASEEDGYTEWVTIARYSLNQDKIEKVSVKDFMVQQGVRYVYAVEQANIWGLKSKKICTGKVTVNFEDMFLTDGKRQLKLRFNPKVSSFKTTRLEQKQETIGSKYPYIFRNGHVAYKEFPIEGLLAYQMDSAHLFFERPYENLIHRHATEYTTRRLSESEKREKEKELAKIEQDIFNYTDLTESNVFMERQFKLQVLDWLNDGKPKYFKSSTEGNYIVRLLNVSMTPTDALGRMLHTVKATAYEIADINTPNFIKYNFINISNDKFLSNLWRSYDLVALSKEFEGNPIELNFDYSISNLNISGVTPGTIFYLYFENEPTPQSIIIGNTGSYRYEGFSKRLVKIVLPNKITGVLECQYTNYNYTQFDAIQNISYKTIIGQQFIGVNPRAFIAETRPGAGNVSNRDSIIKNTSFRYLLNSYTAESVLSILGVNDKNFINYDCQFKAGDIISQMEAKFYKDDIKDKVTVLNIEQVKLQVRELIPIYIVPYEKIDSKVKPTGINSTKYGQNILSNLIFSTIPYGTEYEFNRKKFIQFPYSYLASYQKVYEQYHMNSKYIIFQFYKWNESAEKWEPALVQTDPNAKEGYYQKGHYFDPYYQEIISSYQPYYYINEKFLYKDYKEIPYHFDKDKNISIDIDEVQNLVANEKVYYYNSIAKEYKVYTVNDFQEYIKILQNLQSFPNRMYLYKIDDFNLIDIRERKQHILYNLGRPTKLVIGNGVIAEVVAQLQIIDYFTEENDPKTKKAKEDFLKAYNFLQEVNKVYEKISLAHSEWVKNQTLATVYGQLLFSTPDEEVILGFLEKLVLWAILYSSPEQIADDLFTQLQTDAENFVSPEFKETLDSQDFPTIVAKYGTRRGENSPREYAIENILLKLFNDSTTIKQLQLIDTTEKQDLIDRLYNIPFDNLTNKNEKTENVISDLTNSIDLLEANIAKDKRTYDGLLETVQSKAAVYNSNLYKWIAVKLLQYFGDQGELFNAATGLTTKPNYTLEEEEAFKKNNSDIELKAIQTPSDIYRYYATQLQRLKNIPDDFTTESCKQLGNMYIDIYTTYSSLIDELITYTYIQQDLEEGATLKDYIINTLMQKYKWAAIYREQMQEIKTKLEEEKYQGIDFNKYVINDTIDSVIQNMNITLQGRNNIDTLYTSTNNLISSLTTITQWRDEEKKEVLKNIIYNIDFLRQLMNYYYDSLSTGKIRRLQSLIEVQQTYIDAYLAIGSAEDLDRPIVVTNIDISNINLGDWDFDSQFFANLKERQAVLEILVPLMNTAISNPTWIDGSDYKINSSIVANSSTKTDQFIYQVVRTLSVPDLVTVTNNGNDLQKALDEFNTYILNPCVQTIKQTYSTESSWNQLIVEDFCRKTKYNSTHIQEKHQLYGFNVSSYFSEVAIGKSTEKEQDDQGVEKEKKIEIMQEATGGSSIVRPLDVIIECLSGYSTYTLNQELLDFLRTNDIVNTDRKTNSDTGIFYWYLTEQYYKDLDESEALLEQAEYLQNGDYNNGEYGYSQRLENYNTKYLKYKKASEEAKAIYDLYVGTEYMAYYQQNSVDQEDKLDKKINEVKNKWIDFILALDLGYTNEVERNMYI